MSPSTATVLIAFIAACQPKPAQERTPVMAHSRAIAYLPNKTNARCTITRIIDGDTLKAECQSAGGTIRLAGFDAPETHRPGCAAEKQHGIRARDFLETKLREAQTIVPHIKGRDKYNRTLASLTLDGRPLAQMMINSGHAVAYNGGKRIDWCARLES